MLLYITIPGVSQKKPPEWIRNISKANLEKRPFLWQKGGLGYFKVIKVINNHQVARN